MKKLQIAARVAIPEGGDVVV